MMQTVEAIIDENGRVHLLENVSLPEKRRALLTILEDAPRKIKDLGNQTLADRWADKEEFLQAINEAYAEDNDEEKEFLRLMQIKQAKILDEWK